MCIAVSSMLPLYYRHFQVKIISTQMKTLIKTTTYVTLFYWYIYFKNGIPRVDWAQIIELNKSNPKKMVVMVIDSYFVCKTMSNL